MFFSNFVGSPWADPENFVRGGGGGGVLTFFS